MSAQTLPFKLSVIPPQWRQRLILLFVIACFVLPLAIAWLLLADNWRPSGAAQHGELLNPARPLPDLRFVPIDERPWDQTVLQGHWLMVYVGTAAQCNAPCRTSLYDMRQVRLALGKELVRVKTVLLLDGMPNAELRQWLATEHADMLTGVADAEIRNAFLQAFVEAEQGSGWIYLVDPLGNLLMRYPTTVKPGGMLKDLKRLLRLSKIG
ncbi:MAG TPA: hypothetical protein DEP36_05535 [Gammaproteobacteria bacterium]|nr:hypothetical protein [Gammaproteobacteria bacterium]HRF44590.1 hypothetical protein [Candidatus Competibacteraceae bacterium]